MKITPAYASAKTGCDFDDIGQHLAEARIMIEVCQLVMHHSQDTAFIKKAIQRLLGELDYNLEQANEHLLEQTSQHPLKQAGQHLHPVETDKRLMDKD